MRFLFLLALSIASVSGISEVSAQTETVPAIPPRPISVENWVQTSDYPLEALKRFEEGTVTFRLTIDRRGHPTECAILVSASPDLDAATCQVLMRNARFEPAQASNGVALASKYESELRWELPEVGLVRFAPAISLIETWLEPQRNIFVCRIYSEGILPQTLVEHDCPPNAKLVKNPPRGNGVRTIRAAMLVIGTKPTAWPEIRAKEADRNVFQIKVDWAGVVVDCDKIGGREEFEAPAGRIEPCVFLMNGGDPIFEPTSRDKPFRTGQIELVTSLEAFGDAWIVD